MTVTAWDETIASQEYLDALTARHAVIDARVDIINPEGAIIAALGGPDATHAGVIGGSVSMNTASRSWWTCSLQIDNTTLLPTSVGDLLHPLSHNRVRPWWRIQVSPGRWAEIPMGTYYVQWPEASDNGEANISLTVEGRDATAELSRAKMQNSMNVGGLHTHEAIEQILDEYAPWATHRIEPVTHKLPKDFEAGEPGADPLTIVRELAETVSMIVHADRMGTIVGRRLSDRMSNPVAQFVEGPYCAVTSAGVSVPLDQIANRVKVVSTAREDEDGNELDPIHATVQIDDETSPLWVGHGHYYDHYTETDAVTTVEQARTMGKGILTSKTALVKDIQLEIFPHPHLEGYDTVSSSLSRVGIDGYQEVRGWDMSLDPLGGQRLILSDRREH